MIVNTQEVINRSYGAFRPNMENIRLSSRTHTHTHTHTPLRIINCFSPLAEFQRLDDGSFQLYPRLNGVHLSPLRSK